MDGKSLLLRQTVRLLTCDKAIRFPLVDLARQHQMALVRGTTSGWGSHDFHRGACRRIGTHPTQASRRLEWGTIS